MPEEQQQQQNEGGEGEGGEQQQQGSSGTVPVAELAAERRKRQALEKRLNDLEESNKTETQKAIDRAKAEGRAEGMTEANKRLVRAEIIAAAAGKVHNPATAARLIDMDSITVDDDGNVDAKAVGSAIDRLLKDEPYLAVDGANGAQRQQGTGSGDGGPRGGSAAADSDMNQRIRRAAGR